MNPFIQLDRYAYEEPHYLQLRFRISNGHQYGDAEIYANAEDVKDWGAALVDFPQHKAHVYLWEAGSEYQEDRYAHYMRLRCFVRDSVGHSAIQVRYSNNGEPPHKELFEFTIPVDAAALNRLGSALLRFAALEHEALFWTPEDVTLFKTRKEAEPSRAANLAPLGG